MRQWKVERIATFDDQELATFIQRIDNTPGQKVQQVVYMGDNPQHIRLYQIIYTIE